MAVKKPSTKGLGIYLALLLAFLLMATTLFSQSSNQQLIKYSTVLGYFENGQVSEFNLNLGSGNMTMLVEQNGKKAEVNYRVPNVTQFMYDIEDDIDSYNEEHPDNKMVYDLERAAEIPWFVSMLPTLILVGSMGIFLFMMMRQTRGNGGMSGFSKAKPRTPQDGRVVTFADVAGADEEKEELVEIVEFLKNPAKYNALGARIPKGVLLMGPPGTGKTLLARAVAGEAGVPFYSISGSDFVEMFVGVGASRVRDLFAEAKKTAPSIISSMRSMPWAGTEVPAWAAATTSASRPSTSCWWRWTASVQTRASSSSPPPTVRISWIRRCCVRVGSTVRSW